MYRSLLAICFMLFTAHEVAAEQIYILLDGDCYSRIRYERATANQSTTDYYAYSFRGKNGSRLTFETGLEGSSLQSFIPSGAIACGDDRLNNELALRVNRGRDEVFILRRALNGQYYINKVKAASSLRQDAATVTFTSQHTGLQLDRLYGVVGENVAYKRPSSEVIFEGHVEGACSGSYLFQQINSDANAAHPVINYRISPEIGLVERRLGSDGVNTAGEVILARAVDGLLIDNYLTANCDALRREPSPRPGLPTPPVANTNRPGTSSPNPASRPNTAPSFPNTSPAPAPPAPTQASHPTHSATAHTVTKGETLYAISRRYGVPVAQILTLNKLNGTTIYPGQELLITATTNNAPLANQTVNPRPTAPVITNQPATPPSQVNSLENRTHTVVAGETVASIAMRSGYTEERFRQINDLGPNEYVMPGRSLIVDHCHGYPAVSPHTTSSTINLPSNDPSASGNSGSTPYQTTTQRPIVLPATSVAERPGNPVEQPVTAPRPRAYGNPAMSMEGLERRDPNYDPRPEAQAYTANTTVTYNSFQQSPNPYQGVSLGAKSNDTPAAANSSNQGRHIHTVQRGENLYRISLRYGMKTKDLMQLNGLSTGDVLVPFQKLYID